MSKESEDMNVAADELSQLRLVIVVVVDAVVAFLERISEATWIRDCWQADKISMQLFSTDKITE
ncbi:hypothetical protein T08_14380, partial [Trichinella sp. T8]